MLAQHLAAQCLLLSFGLGLWADKLDPWGSGILLFVEIWGGMLSSGATTEHTMRINNIPSGCLKWYVACLLCPGSHTKCFSSMTESPHRSSAIFLVQRMKLPFL